MLLGALHESVIGSFAGECWWWLAERNAVKLVKMVNRRQLLCFPHRSALHLANMYSFYLYSLFFIATYLAVPTQSTERIDPIRQCDGCRDVFLESVPGLGFHLGLTSG